MLIDRSKAIDTLTRIAHFPALPQPNLWQVRLGTLKMIHRVLFNSSTIGLCTTDVPRRNLRARLLSNRLIRFPFLVKEQAITPLDLTGFCSSPETIINHLLTAHHDGVQFIYDFQLLELYDGALEQLHRRVSHIVENSNARARWLRDLTVFENYHESLLNASAQYISGQFSLAHKDTNNPDISFHAFLSWLTSLPDSPKSTPKYIKKRISEYI